MDEGTDDHAPDQPSGVIRYRTVLARAPIRRLAGTRLAASVASASIFYAVLVYLAREGASQFEITVASAVSFVAVLALGRQGGLVSDATPKGRLLTATFLLQAALCLVIPALLGVDYAALTLLIFLSTAVNLLSAPALRTAIAFVAERQEVPTTAALIALIGVVGAAAGSSIVAPLVLKGAGIQVALLASGVLYLGAALIVRGLRIDDRDRMPLRDTIRTIDWRPRGLSPAFNARWLMTHPAVGSMMLGGIVVGVLYQGLHMLLPGYMTTVLHEDPTDIIFIFLPAGIGLIIGAFLAPAMVRHLGPRRLLLLSLALISAGMVLLGFVVPVAPLFAPLNPMGIVDPFFGVPVSGPMLAAGIIALPANLGSAWAIQSVQVFINLTVPRDRQGEAFAIQKVQNNLLLLIMIPTFGFLATHFGTTTVFVVAPLVVAGITLLLVRLSFRYVAGHAAPAGLAARFVLVSGDIGEDDDAISGRRL